MAGPWERFSQPALLQTPSGPWQMFAAPHQELTREEQLRSQAREQLARERAENPALANLNAPGGAENALRGLPIVGGFLDEARAGISAGANYLTGGRVGQPYDEALAYERERYSQHDAENPVSSTVTKLAGGLAAAPFTPVMNAMTTLGRIGAGAVTGAGYGAGHGFAEGEGGFGERVGTAMDYAKVGGAIGGGLPAAGALTSWTVNQARSAAPHIAARLPGRNADRIADDIIARRMERSGTTPQQVEAELVAGQNAAQFGPNSRAQLPEMIADTSDAMQRLTGSVYRQGGRAGEIVRDALETRQRGDPNQISRFASGDTGQRGQIDDALSRALRLSTSESARSAERRIAAEQAREGRRLYEDAYRNSEDFDIGPAIVALGLTRQQYTGPFRAALDRASALFEAPMGAMTRGNRNFYGMDIRRFDAAKKQLDDMIESAQRQGENNLARELTQFKNNLLDRVHAVDEAGNPTRNLAYRDARMAWGSAAENREAIELGRAALREGSEVSLEQYRGLTPGQQVFFRQGFLESARNAINNRRPGNDATLPFQTARVQDLLREIIPNTQRRTGVFADRAGNFGEYLSRQERMGQTRNRVLGNSATQQRQMDDAEFTSDAMSRIMVFFGGARNMAIEFVGAILKKTTAYRQDVAEALARRLVNADHAQQVQLLRTLQRRIGPQRFQTLMRELDAVIPVAPGALMGEAEAPTQAIQPPSDRFQPPMRLGGPTEADEDTEARRQRFIELFGVDPNQSTGGFALETLKNFGYEALPAVAATVAGPVARGVSAALTYAPRATAAAAGMIGLTAPSTAGDGEDRSALRQLYAQRSSLDQRRSEAEEEAKAQQRTGRGPRYKEAVAKVTQINNEIAAVDKLIAEEQKRNSPEYRLEMEQKRKVAEEEQRQKDAATPTRERFAEIMPYVPVITGAVATALGAALKTRAISNYNKEIADLTSRWLKAVEEGNKALGRGNKKAAERFATAAEGFRKKFDAKLAKGPGGTKEALEAGAGVSLIGAFAPEEVDFARAAAGSPLWDSLRETVIENWQDTLKRAGIAIGLGMGLGHIGSLGVKPLISRPIPQGYGPETDAILKGIKQRAPRVDKKQPPQPPQQRRSLRKPNP